MNKYEAVPTVAGTLYIACEVASHCSWGQKVTITVLPRPADGPWSSCSSAQLSGDFNGVNGFTLGVQLSFPPAPACK